MRTRSFLTLTFALAAVGACAASAPRQTCPAGITGAAAHAAPMAAGAAQPPNAVQREMRLLTAAMEATVRAIAAGDVRGVKQEIHRVHTAKDATDAALRDGSYRLPKNADQLGAFRALDEAFHQSLGPLVAASRDNDAAAAATAMGPILQSCQGCHALFRP